MSDIKNDFTHKGWYWFCPIYISPDDPECPVAARSEWFEFLFDFCGMLDAARIWLTTYMNPDYEPTFMFKVTGKINE